MMRTKTTLVVGAGASAELQFPDSAALLARIAGGLDLARLGTEVVSDDIAAMAAHLEAIAEAARVNKSHLFKAGQQIRSAARLGGSIDAVLEQFGDNPMVLAVGKLAITHFTLAAEAESPLAAEPRDPGDLPVRGSENWLFQLAQAIVSGVPRAKVDRCLDNLSIISFDYDRSIETYLPWVLSMAFGMSIVEARALVAEKLRLIHVYGTPGRLDWQSGKEPVADWGARTIDNLPAVVEQIHSLSERLEERGFKRKLFGELVFGKRLLFLGFGFDAMNCSLLFDAPMEHYPDVYIAMPGASETQQVAVRKVLLTLAKLKQEEAITIADVSAWQLLRDYASYLQS